MRMDPRSNTMKAVHSTSAAICILLLVMTSSMWAAGTYIYVHTYEENEATLLILFTQFICMNSTYKFFRLFIVQLDWFYSYY
jgi:hypothetical protein